MNPMPAQLDSAELKPSAHELFCVPGTRVCRGIVCWALVLFAAIASGQEVAHPLKPPDRSSPRAALETFLQTGDAFGGFLATNYLPSPSRAKFDHLLALGDATVGSLDLTEVPPAARVKTGRAAAVALYETLNRIQLPPFGDIPGADQLERPEGTNMVRWVIPDTEIVLIRARNGPRSGEFLFSPETVAKAGHFYKRVRGLAYTRAVPLKGLREITETDGGWMIPHAWIQALPEWLRTPIAGQSGWKWIVLVLVLGGFSLLVRWVYRLSHRGSTDHPFLHALAQLALPAFFLLGTPVVAYLALAQFNLTGGVGSAIELAVTAVMFLAGAGISWRVAPVIAEAIIASPRIAPESIDAHLIRICTRLLGIVAAAGLLGMGAARLGLPLYGIIAGLGVGGRAIALAAQPTIENLIGGLSLFADKPVRVGDFCKYGTDVGTIEAIGIRSTRIRGIDRTLTTIPNAAFSKMPVVNFTRRDRMLIHCVIGVRYQTSPDQLRYLLLRIQELLRNHPRIHPDPARVLLVGFGSSSLDLELFAYVTTSDWGEFLRIRQEVLLHIMDLVEESGTGFAFPSQTLYFARDKGLDLQRTQAAEERARQLRAEGSLPFPEFSWGKKPKGDGAEPFPVPERSGLGETNQNQRQQKPE